MPNPFFSLQTLGQSNKTRAETVRVSKSSLRFGPMEMVRANTVPPFDYGRPGDIVVIDNTDSPSNLLQSNQTPSSVGLWQKLPLSYDGIPSGNIITGQPEGYAQSGDVININGTDIVLTAPFTVDTAVGDINAAAIPSVTAQNIGRALMIIEGSSEALTITDTSGSATATLGIYSQESIFELTRVRNLVINGLWMPLGGGGSSTSGGSSSAASYLTISPNADLTSERIITPTNGIVGNDSGTTYQLEMDVSTLPAAAEALDTTDTIPVYNQSTAQTEQVSVTNLIDGLDLVTEDEAVQHNSIIIGTAASTNVGDLIPAGAVVRTVILDITSAYTGGTTITIGDSGSLDRFMKAIDNDPAEVNTFETSTIIDIATATQTIATVSGSPTSGSARVIIDYIIP